MDNRRLRLSDRMEGDDRLTFIDQDTDNWDEVGGIDLTGDDEYDKEDREPLAAELVKRWNTYPELVGALRELMRYCVTAEGFPEKGKGRTHEQQAAFDEARALLASIEEKP